MSKYLKGDRSVLSKMKREITKLLPRKFHCFCVGAEKTGTTSIHGMFKSNYRSGHEVDPQPTIQIVIDYLKGYISKRQVRKVLKNRDELLNLEMESAHHLVYVSNILTELFPEAKFIITIREPYSHLESRLNWHRTPNNPAWNSYVNYFLEDKHDGYEKEERLLKNHNLYSLDTFLKQYSDHYKCVFKYIPKKKRIFIKTKELDKSTKHISSFLDIDKSTIQLNHSNKRSEKIQILSKMEQHFVRDKIWEHCSDMIQKFFPETIYLY